MDLLNAAILGIVQGITEFLPISSTGHLILTARLLGLTQTDFLKSFEIAIQLGTILSVVVLYGRSLLVDAKVLKRLIVAFAPTAVLGLVFYNILKKFLLGNSTVVLWSLFLGGIFLIIFELLYREKENATAELQNISYKNSFLIGIFQSIAMIPGVSRSAATIIGGLALGLKRKTIVEFSFLLAVPTMLAATGLDLIKSAGKFTANQFVFLAVGFFTSFIVALFAIKFLIYFIKNHNFIPFGIYRIILALLFGLIIISQASADTIYLKNQRTMDGIIESENNSELVLDIGFGTVTISQGEIEHVVKSTEAEKEAIINNWKNRYRETGRWIPRGAERLFTDLKEIKAKREEIVKAEQKREALQDRIDTQESALSELYKNFEESNAVLAKTAKKDAFSYNKMVADVNTMSARLEQLKGEIKTNLRNKNDLDNAFSNSVSEYIKKIEVFRQYFNGEYTKLKQAKMSEEDSNFYKWTQEEARRLREEFERKEIAFSRAHAGIIVDVVLNSSVTVPMVVDTGASLVTISKRTAEQLGVYNEKDLKKIELFLANGKKAGAFLVTLDSVNVGGFELKNVMAAIIEKDSKDDVEGLLGMSFLGKFLVKIDSTGSKLMLERFTRKE